MRFEWTRPVGAVFVCLVLGLSASCTSSDGATPTSDSPSSVTPSSTALPSVTSISSPSSSVSSASSPSSTAAPASWPADLSRQQVAEAQAAIAAYTGYYKLVDQAYAAPGKDWSSKAARWATDPVKSSFLKNLAGTAKLGQYGTGSIVAHPMVTKVEPALVTMTDCVDATNVGFYDRSGNSIKAPDASGSYFRHVSEVQVAEYQGNQWLVTFITDDYTKRC